MRLSDKINMKKSLIVFPIIAVMAGTTLVGAFSSVFVSDAVPSEDVVGKSLEDIVKDDKALKIIDIHENLENYLEKEVTLEGFFIGDGEEKLFGVEVPIGEGEMTLASLVFDLENEVSLDDVSETDLVSARGTISSFEQVHKEDEESEEPHTHTIPKFHITSVEVKR